MAHHQVIFVQNVLAVSGFLRIFAARNWFYPDTRLSEHEQIKELRDRVYEAMRWRAGQDDNFEYIKYVKKED